jgi:acetylglutamate kinase
VNNTTDISALALTHHATVMLKLGGNAIDSADVLARFADQVVALRSDGVRVIVSHGGGPQIDERLAAAGVHTERVGGLRVTSAEAMQIIRDVMVLEMQTGLVDAINSAADRAGFLLKPLATGMSPEGTRLFRCRKHEELINGLPFDFGHVGDVTHVDTRVVESVLAKHRVPVVTGIGIGETDHKSLFNINADSAAAALAGALHVDEFIMVSNVPGVYRDFARREGLIEQLTSTQAKQMLPSLDGGMVPKMQACIDALAAGARRSQMMAASDLGLLGSVVLEGRNVGTRVIEDVERKVARSVADRHDAVVSVSEADTYSG